jgi:hypothetical protein
LTGPANASAIVSATNNSIYIVAAPSATPIYSDTNCFGNVLFGDHGADWCVEVNNSNSGSVLFSNPVSGSTYAITTGGLSTSLVQLYATRITGTTTTNIAINSGGTYSGTGSATTLASLTGYPVQIGARYDGTSGFTGKIASVAVWSADVGGSADTVIRTAFKNYYGIASW